MKKTLVFLLFITININAQNNVTEAIAAFQLAEESYEKGEFKTALRFLETVKKNLGTSNCKLIYLQIQIELELYKTDRNLYDQLMKSITEFQSLPDVNSFNKDKVMEVIKTKMMLSNQHETETKTALETQVFEKEFKEFNIHGWQTGDNLAELQRKYPEFFKKAHKSSLGNGVEVFINLKFPEGTCLRNNITYSINQNLFNGPDDINFSKTKAALDKLLNDLNTKITIKPIVTNTSGAGFTSTHYSWSNGNKSVGIMAVFMTDLKSGSINLSFNDLSYLVN